LVAGWPPEPSRLVNLPNSITLSRIFSIPLLVWILSGSHFSSANGEKELLASALFIAAAMTDGIDGYLARKRDQITTMGILLDPIADKLLIAAAFVVQIVSVVAVILDHRWKEWPIYSHYIFPVHWVAYVAIWFMVCVSLVSGIDYFVAFWSKIDRRVVKRRRRAFVLSRRRKPVSPPQADRDVAAST
jgi:CDP-diacylglycerol--glycerol-3-phosphate 3-phosphatidyltransferase